MDNDRIVGPLLYLRGVSDDRLLLTAVLVLPAHADGPALLTGTGSVSGTSIREIEGRRVLHYAFSLPAAADAWYELEGVRYQVNAAWSGDLRIAFVSCNGQEEGDRERSPDERNALWRRLMRQHDERPLNLILHGGDQIYADELVNCHPLVRRWADGADVGNALSAEDRNEVAQALRRAFLRRYFQVLAQPEIAWLMARVPSLAMWDDHDICDGWGSMRETKLDAPIGQMLFSAARELFLMFQLGSAPDHLPDICLDQSGASLSWQMRLPQLTMIAPDLRSERRPDRVMGERGWSALETALGRVEAGRVLVLSTVPALGPRLSWLEGAMHFTPHAEKYEDDLRDQWQSRAHRAEWRRFLELLLKCHDDPDTPLTVVSGEIHLATRGTLDGAAEPLHQLVASGIAHPAPPILYARALGALARFGESPVPSRSVRLYPLPGKSAIYTAQRNYLVLARLQDRWQAWWELERDGPTAPLQL
ncbi:MAG TPA: alkaline phosphatase D family protein [Afifellaceae bacterium]|nr:alkaline phosphatase D family protein [Afifellaceae bacterium]